MSEVFLHRSCFHQVIPKKMPKYSRQKPSSTMTVSWGIADYLKWAAVHLSRSCQLHSWMPSSMQGQTWTIVVLAGCSARMCFAFDGYSGVRVFIQLAKWKWFVPVIMCCYFNAFQSGMTCWKPIWKNWGCFSKEQKKKIRCQLSQTCVVKAVPCSLCKLHLDVFFSAFAMVWIKLLLWKWERY